MYIEVSARSIKFRLNFPMQLIRLLGQRPLRKVDTLAEKYLLRIWQRQGKISENILPLRVLSSSVSRARCRQILAWVDFVNVPFKIGLIG